MINQELQKRQIPSFLDGICTAEEWESQRQSILELLLNEEYGTPPQKITPSIEKIEKSWIDFAGKAEWESIYLTLENNGKSHTVKTDLILPTGVKRPPVFLYISFSPEIPSKYLPVEEIIDEGFGIYTFYYEDVTSDSGKKDGLASLFDADCGKITLWAYMARICMDYLCTRNEIDAKRVAIIGHSRLGKTALLASAQDDRFFLTCSNDSGCCGASLSRGKNEKNETIKAIHDTFPFWFKSGFEKYKDNEEALPFDQHMLLSLIAPRYLMIGGAIKDEWADNEGQFLSCYLASKIWTLYGKNGFVHENKMPSEGDMLLSGEVAFYLRGGTHFLSRTDWQIYMKRFKEIL